MSGNEPLPVWLCGAVILGVSAAVYKLAFWLFSLAF